MLRESCSVSKFDVMFSPFFLNKHLLTFSFTLFSFSFFIFVAKISELFDFNLPIDACAL